MSPTQFSFIASVQPEANGLRFGGRFAAGYGDYDLYV